MSSIPQIQPDYARLTSNARQTESTRRCGHSTAQECRRAAPRYAGQQLFASRAPSYGSTPRATVAKEYRAAPASVALIHGIEGALTAAEALTAALLVLHAIQTVRPRVSVVVVFSFSFFAMSASYLPERARRAAAPAPAWQPPPSSVRIEEMPDEQPVRRRALAAAPAVAPRAEPVVAKPVQTAPALDEILTGQPAAKPVTIPSLVDQEATLAAQKKEGGDLLGAAQKLSDGLQGVNKALRQPSRDAEVDQMMADLGKDLGLPPSSNGAV
jgi:hypothetical protein